MTARYIIGDTRDVTATLPDASVDLVLTSPPFLALRSYLPDDHPDKHREIGSEATPADFLDGLLDLTEEWARVLAPHGSIVVELGDTYAGSGGAGGDYTAGGLKEGQNAFVGSSSLNRKMTKNARVQSDEHAQPIRDMHGKVQGGGRGWPLDKSLCGIPHLYHLSLAYGRNLLRPERTTEPWRVRNVVAWCRPNPPVGALGDKFRPATSYMTVATKARDRWFDLDAVRSDPADVKDQRVRTTNGPKNHADPREVLTANYTERIPSNPAGAPPLDWWNIPTQPYAGSHYATFPKALCVRPILAMCPEKVCTTCGEPSRRITGEVTYTRDGEQVDEVSPWAWGGVEKGKSRQGRSDDYRLTRQAPTLGWTDCGHDTWRPGIVLDPFAGSGTTLAVATGHGRDAIGIDIDERNAELALERVGPLFLTIEHHGTEDAIA